MTPHSALRVRKTFAVGVFSLALAFALAGCSQIENAVTGAVSDGVHSVTESAKAAASAELITRICAPINDGTITAEDRALLSGLVSAAQTAGLGSDFVTAMKQIADSTSPVSTHDVAAFVASCDSGAEVITK